MFELRTPLKVPGQLPSASVSHVAPPSEDFPIFVQHGTYQSPPADFQAWKLPCMCSRELTLLHAAALIVPSRYFAPAVPPVRPAVVVRQIPFEPLLSWAITHHVVPLIGRT